MSLGEQEEAEWDQPRVKEGVQGVTWILGCPTIF